MEKEIQPTEKSHASYIITHHSGKTNLDESLEISKNMKNPNLQISPSVARNSQKKLTLHDIIALKPKSNPNSPIAERNSLIVPLTNLGKHIMLTLDPKENSPSALKFASKLIRSHDILFLTMVIPKHSPELREKANNLLQDAEEQVAKEKIVSIRKIIIESSHIGAALCKSINELEIDLTLTGTRGIEGWKKIFIDSTSEYLIENANCSVLVIPPEK